MTRPSPFDGGIEESFGARPAENRATRLPLLLLVDASNSMHLDAGGMPRIEVLARTLERLLTELREIGDARRGGEVAMITFGDGGVRRVGLHAPGGPAPLSAFTPLMEARLPRLTAGGATPLAAALDAAADLIEERHRQLSGQLRYRTNVWLITDGENTDEDGYFVPLPDAPINRLRRLEDDRRALFFACALPGANREELQRIAPRTTAPVNEVDFADIVNRIVVSSSAVLRMGARSTEDIYDHLDAVFARFGSPFEP
jgi:uncharacterized protein YegL